MAVRTFDAQASFEGGINLTADISQVRPNELRKARNARLSEFGGATKRGGTQNVTVDALAASPVLGGYGWSSDAGDLQLAMCDGQIFTGTYGIPMTFTPRTGTFSTTEYPSFVGFRDASADACYIADGGLLNKIVGTTITTNIASTPSVGQLALYNLRLFGISGLNSTLYYSALGNGDTLGIVASGGGSAIIRTFGEQRLIGLLPLGGSLMLVHRAGISRFTGWSLDDIDIDSGSSGVSTDTGTIAPRSLVAVENVGFLVSDNGVYQLTEEGVTPIGQKLEAMIKSLGQANFERIQAAHHRAFKEVHFFFPGVGTYLYNYRLGKWSGPWNDGYLANDIHSMWQTYDSDGSPIVLVGNENGQVLRVDAPSIWKDNVFSDGSGGTTFSLELQLHRIYFRDPELYKSIRFFYITRNSFAGAAAYLRWATEEMVGQIDLPASGGTALVWGVGTWDPTLVWPSASTRPQRVQGWGSGTYIDLTIVDDSPAPVSYTRILVEGFTTARRF